MIHWVKQKVQTGNQKFVVFQSRASRESPMPRLAFDDRGWRMAKKKRKSIEFKRAVNENAAAELDRHRRQQKLSEIYSKLMESSVSLRPENSQKAIAFHFEYARGGFGDAARRRKMLKIFYSSLFESSHTARGSLGLLWSD